MKKQSLLKSMLLLCALVAGSSNGWAVETVYHRMSYIYGTNNSYTSNGDVTVDGITWNVGGNCQQPSAWRIGGKKITTATNRFVYSKTAMDKLITKAIFTFGSTFSSQLTLNSVKLTVSTEANGAGTLLDEVTKTSGFGADNTLEFIPSAGKEWSEGAYYKLTFNFTTDNVNTNRFLEIKQTDFYADVTTITTPAVSSAGWATYLAKCACTFTDGDAYVVSSASSSSVTLTSVTNVPKGTPVLLKGAGAKTATAIASAPAVVNKLKTSAFTTGEGIGDYVLGEKSSVVGFYKWNGTKLSGEKVYLPADEVGAAREFLGLDDMVTGITNANSDTKTLFNSDFYNVAGQRVTQPTKGLYIVNGKKVIIK